MADIQLTAAPVLGADIALDGNRIRERADLALVSVAVPLGGDDALAGAVRSAWGLAMPGPVQSSGSGDMRALRTTPDQIMLIFPHAAPDAARMVQGKLGGAGYVTDQTDVWVVLDIDGPQTLAALERLCPLDLSGFGDGGSARTVMEHMGAIILRLGSDRFWLISASSSARSFLHAVETSFRNVL